MLQKLCREQFSAHGNPLLVIFFWLGFDHVPPQFAHVVIQL